MHKSILLLEFVFLSILFWKLFIWKHDVFRFSISVRIMIQGVAVF